MQTRPADKAAFFQTDKISGDKEQIGHDPRGRIGEANCIEAKMRHKTQRKYAACDGLKHACDGRKTGVAKPLNGEAYQIHTQPGNVEGGIAQQHAARQRQDLGSGVEILGVQKQPANVAALKYNAANATKE